ncbi:sensor histidine kinase [Nostoc sphaeroides]|uniref:sensor histidine kinase n=1 Tax=Nostoc sphaeroides TaxID=446679 RepID=UPI001CED96B3|nr:ATP-binding protein [Nostoc sphaeroides]
MTSQDILQGYSPSEQRRIVEGAYQLGITPDDPTFRMMATLGRYEETIIDLQARMEAMLVLNQIIDGAYGQSLEEIKPLLIALQQTNERGMSLIQSKRTAFLELNPVTVEQFDMLSFLQNNYSRFKPIAQYHSLNLHYETQSSYKHGTQVRGDSISIDRMLCNLVTNAIKYTLAGDIFLRLLNQEDDLVIEIEDTGCGIIAAEQISNIFIPLWRAPNSNLFHQSGMGLGLYIALCVAHAHGLRISVNSVVRQGTKFTIVFSFE